MRNEQKSSDGNQFRNTAGRDINISGGDMKHHFREGNSESWWASYWKPILIGTVSAIIAGIVLWKFGFVGN